VRSTPSLPMTLTRPSEVATYSKPCRSSKA
jgi:hypothetical protein